jgi:hypothetical protein
MKLNISAAPLSTVVMKNSIFSDLTPCNPLKVNQRFRKIVTSVISLDWYGNEAGGMKISPTFMISSCLAYASILNMDDMDMFQPSIGLLLTDYTISCTTL